MNVTALEIETIVRAVLQRLRTGTSIPKQPATRVGELDASDTTFQYVAAPTSSTSSTSSTTTTDTLALDLGLITLDSLRGKLRNIKTIQVPRRAVVTPAVIDELRQQKIQLDRSLTAAGDKAKSLASTLRLVATAPVITQLESMARGVNFASTEESATPEATHITLTAHLVTPDRRVIWLTQTPFAATRASQAHVGTRCVQLSHPGQLGQAESEANPNLLILDASTWTTPAVAQLLRNWRGADQ